MSLEDLKKAKKNWEEKRAYYELELSITDSVEKKFALPKKIEECKKKIKEIEEELKSRESQSQVPAQISLPSRSDTSYTEFLYSLPEAEDSHNFQNRHNEIEWIRNFLNSSAIRIMFLIGREGIGKTQMVSRAIKYLTSLEPLHENNSAYDNEKPNVNNVGYFTLSKEYLIVSEIFNGLCELLPTDKADILKKYYRDPHIDIRGKVNILLSEFSVGQTLLILDDFDKVLNPQTRSVQNRELEEILCALRDYWNYHPIKVIIISRYPPRQSAVLSPENTVLRLLDKGLESPHAENYLRQKDVNGRLTIYSDDDLQKICARLYGFPRALKALSWTLQLNIFASLEDIFNDAETLINSEEYRDLIEVIIGQEFKSLGSQEQQVMQILAVFNHPILQVVVEDLAKQYKSDINPKAILKSLGEKQLVQVLRNKKGRYLFLNPIDAEYAFSQIKFSDNSGLTQIDILHKAANYFKERREYSERTIDILKYESLIELVELGLAEFDLRYRAQEYNNAAQILIDIGPSLLQLGNYGVVRENHEHLQDKIIDPHLKAFSITELGTAYLYSGQYEKAISYYSVGLVMARETKNRELEGKCLNNMGNCYYYLGDFDSAIEKHQAALKIAREAKNRELEAERLNNIGGCYESLVQIDIAIFYYKQSVSIIREVGNSKVEGFLLNNLGICYKDLGMIDSAIDYHKQARDIARSTEDIELAGQCYCCLGNCYTVLGDFDRATNRYEKALLFTHGIGDLIGEGITLHSLAEVLIDFDQYVQAIEYARKGLSIGKLINSSKLKAENNCALARAYLSLQNLPNAYSSARAAQECKLPEYRYYALALLGLIALRQGNQQIAHEAFTESLVEVESVLAKNSRKYEALDIKGLSLLGLTLCGSKDYLDDAKKAYQEAREISNHAGNLRRVLRFLHELEILVGDLKLEEVRAVISQPKKR